MNPQAIANGGLQYVPQIAVQYVYLDFDGELTSYDGEILSLDHVAVQHSNLTKERITDIVAELNTKYTVQNVIFVTERPTIAEYSTIYIGKTDAFNTYGNFSGLAETIDDGNKNTTDNAFVMLDASATNLEIISTISHEADHLLGALNHGGEGLNAYAANTTIAAGTTSTGLTVSNGNSLTVLGTANSTTVNSSGRMYISRGGVANNTIMSGGNVIIYNGGVANNTIVSCCYSDKDLYCGSITILSGGTANSTTVNTGGRVTISSGGLANETTVNSDGCIDITHGGVANRTTVSSRGYMDITSGGVANRTTVSSGGRMTISSGGTATDIVASSGARLEITVALNTYIQGTYAGSAFEMKNAQISGYTVNSSSCMAITSGGEANSTTVNGWNAAMYISSGGVANSTTVGYDGGLYISNGGVANRTTVSSGGRMTISSGGEANSTTVNIGGVMYISNGGVANSTTVKDGYMTIASGGVASNTIVNSGGMAITSGGEANRTTVKDGHMAIYIGGEANSTTVNSGGDMYIFSGGVHRGSLLMAAGAVVYAYSGGIIDFTLVDRSANDGCLINDLSRISGNPTYTITVSADQTSGSYKLAQGAENFTGTISIGTDGSNYGTLTVNGATLKYNGICCSLTQKNGELTLNIQRDSVINLSSDKNGVAFTGLSGNTHVVEFSKDNFTNVLALRIAGNAVDTYNLSAGTYQWQVDENKGDNIVSNNAAASEKFISDADGNLDLFFADADGVWGKGYAAEHQGSLNGWKGTGEQVELLGKNRIADVFAGSNDANVLVLSDDANGDALFVDDIYTTFGKDAARLAQIDEIRAGAGDDIVDMTSQQFAYSDGVTIYGGSGADTIWANNGTNTLFGDAGNDRIVGGSGNDVIIGGSGNDTLYGGGGEDIFCFGGEWGVDTVEQLASGKVTLWFEEGDDTGWNATTMTYTDGANTVTVNGVANVTLKFGNDATLPDGAFADAASEKIFEDKNKGMIA